MTHYIDYLYPGFPIMNHSTHEIAERDENKVELPEGCVGFRFFDKSSDSSKRENISGWYYKGEKVTTDDLNSLLEEIKTWPRTNAYGYQVEKINNMLDKLACLSTHAAVITADNQLLQLFEGDTVLI